MKVKKTYLISYHPKDGVTVEKSFSSFCQRNGLSREVLVNAKKYPVLNEIVFINDHSLLKLENSEKLTKHIFEILTDDQVKELIGRMKK